MAWKKCLIFFYHPWNFTATVREIDNLSLVWVFLDDNSNLNWQIAMKWHTKLLVTWKKCATVFQGHPWNFKLTWVRRIDDLAQNLSVSMVPMLFAAIKSLRFALFKFRLQLASQFSCFLQISKISYTMIFFHSEMISKINGNWENVDLIKWSE